MFSISRLTAFVALASLATVKAQNGACIRTYEVKPGDVCDKIAASQGVSTFQVIAANVGVIDSFCSNLFPSQIICLARTDLNCSPVVVVQPGNTCNSIAVQAGISPSDLARNNPNISTGCTNIYPGLVLCVQPAGPGPTSVPTSVPTSAPTSSSTPSSAPPSSSIPTPVPTPGR